MLIECPRGHEPEYFLARPLGFELPYRVRNDGLVTGLRFDGVAGITDEMKELIESTDNVFCPICYDGVNFKHDKKAADLNK